MRVARKQLILLGLILLASAVFLAAGDKKSKTKDLEATANSSAVAPMPDEKKIVHALNRLTFGVRPGEVERVRAMGMDKWFDQQLHPEKINDSAMEARLAPFRTLKMSTREMVSAFPPPQVLKAVENGRMSMPSDPGKRAVYESRMAAYEQRKQKKEDKAAANDGATNAGATNADQPAAAADGKDSPAQMRLDPNDPPMTPEQLRQQKRREDAMYADIEADNLLQMPPEDRYKAILKMSA